MNTTARRAMPVVRAGSSLNTPLAQSDPEIFNLIEHEKRRQRDSLVLIASENFASKSVFDALGSVMSNKYSEGYPGARYYGGNENIDQVTSIAIDRPWLLPLARRCCCCFCRCSRHR